ncbi:DUF4959 domain-containing protein [Bacteroides sp.]|uniref:DUF4959 domain-containing protein n=1 Tax=Bacteroides sp. TaxID=29523 RepID=UPI00262385EC|nr:DUF4959 domain-containing protein [Bacteroides sp.]MDD3036549.1 DUF4959 domain-containing protein [Bacteroides sp.]
MKTKLILIYILICGAILGCKEDEVRAPYGDNDTTPPKDVSNVTIKSIAGGAVLKYDIPDDPDLLYVKAVFEAKAGVVREVRSSMYIDSLVIKGIGDVNEHKVTIYAVDRSENLSKGISASIIPNTPPVLTVRESLLAEADWGGFRLSLDNAGKDPISIMVYYSNTETEGSILHNVYYTEQAKGPLAIRGLNALPSHFSVKVRDRWENESEPYEFDLTPLKEVLLDAKRFKEMFIPGDVRFTFFGGGWDRFFNDNYSAGDFAHTDYPQAFPHPTTIDMGETVLLSRMKIWQRLVNEDFYKHACPRHFMIYGCPENLDPYKEENYTLLMDGHLEKPSGGEFTDPNTSEDILAAEQGHEFLFENDLMKPVRYVRFISLASWSGMECTRIAEMKFWGQYVNESTNQ